MDTTSLERRLTDAFSHGVRRRELRLTGGEAQYITQAYPSATVKALGEGWYEITFREATSHEK